MERRVHMRLRTENAADRQFLEWLDEVYTDKDVPLRTLLVPILLKGIEAERKEQQLKMGETAARSVKTWIRPAPEALNGEGSEESRTKIEPQRSGPTVDEEFPLAKLSFE